jgi:hypothetical protein
VNALHGLLYPKPAPSDPTKRLYQIQMFATLTVYALVTAVVRHKDNGTDKSPGIHVCMCETSDYSLKTRKHVFPNCKICLRYSSPLVSSLL